MEVGDEVELKSGGPKMTVDLIMKASGNVRCTWFDSRKKMERAVFAPSNLKKVS